MWSFCERERSGPVRKQGHITRDTGNGHHEENSGTSILLASGMVSDRIAEEPEPIYRYTLSSEFSTAQHTVASVAFLKRPVVLESRSPLARQLNVVNLPGIATFSDTGQANNAGSPFEVLHSLLHNAITPYFDAYARTRDSATAAKFHTDADSKTGIPGTKKRMAELELSLLHLQQSIDIPIVQLPVHPLIQEVLRDAQAEGRSPSVQMIPQNVLDNANLLNALTNTVNNWTRSIQSLTKLTKDSERRVRCSGDSFLALNGVGIEACYGAATR